MAAIVIVIYAIILYHNLTEEIPEEEYENLSDDEFNDKYKWHFLGPITGIVFVSLQIIVYTILIAGL
jgi:hypothetical protein